MRSLIFYPISIGILANLCHYTAVNFQLMFTPRPYLPPRQSSRLFSQRPVSGLCYSLGSHFPQGLNSDMISFTVLISGVTYAFTYKILNFRNTAEICNIIIMRMYVSEEDSPCAVVLWQSKNIISGRLLCQAALSATETANTQKPVLIILLVEYDKFVLQYVVKM
jgi:hypothetical protein